MQAHISRPVLSPLIMLVVIVAAAAALALVGLVAVHRTTGMVTKQPAAPATQTVTQTKTAPVSNAGGDCAGERWKCQTTVAAGNVPGNAGTLATGGSVGTAPSDQSLRANECLGERWKC